MFTVPNQPTEPVINTVKQYSYMRTVISSVNAPPKKTKRRGCTKTLVTPRAKLFYFLFCAPLPLSSPRGVSFLAIFLAAPRSVHINPRPSFRQHCCCRYYCCCCCSCRCCFYLFTLKTFPSTSNRAPPRYPCRQTYDLQCFLVDVV